MGLARVGRRLRVCAARSSRNFYGASLKPRRKMRASSYKFVTGVRTGSPIAAAVFEFAACSPSLLVNRWARSSTQHVTMCVGRKVLIAAVLASVIASSESFVCHAPAIPTRPSVRKAAGAASLQMKDKRRLAVPLANSRKIDRRRSFLDLALVTACCLSVQKVGISMCMVLVHVYDVCSHYV